MNRAHLRDDEQAIEARLASRRQIINAMHDTATPTEHLQRDRDSLKLQSVELLLDRISEARAAQDAAESKLNDISEALESHDGILFGPTPIEFVEHVRLVLDVPPSTVPSGRTGEPVESSTPSFHFGFDSDPTGSPVPLDGGDL
jgi:hypothetical protein